MTGTRIEFTASGRCGERRGGWRRYRRSDLLESAPCAPLGDTVSKGLRAIAIFLGLTLLAAAAILAVGLILYARAGRERERDAGMAVAAAQEARALRSL